MCVPFNSRSTAWASFDGRGRVELKRACVVLSCQRLSLTQVLVSEGDHIKVTASKFPFPTVCADKQSTDWFHAISRTLKWNERERQKSFVVVEEGPAKEEVKHHQLKKHAEPIATANIGDGDREDDEGDSDEEEEKFDIDDLSSENSDTAPPSGKSVDSGSTSSSGTSPSSAAASRAAEALMGVSPRTHAKERARARSRSGVRSGVDSPSRFAPVPPRSGHGHVHGHVQWAATAPGSQNDKGGQTDGETGDIYTPTTAAPPRRMRSRSPAAPIVHSHQHPRAFAVWGQDESDSNSSDNDP